MYSIKFAAKLVNIKELRNRIVEKLSIFIVLSTYYLTFRLQNKSDEYKNTNHPGCYVPSCWQQVDTGIGTKESKI